MKKVLVLTALVALFFLGMTSAAVAADVSGTWKLAAPQMGGGGGGGMTMERTLTLKQEGDKLTGKLVVKFGENPPTEAVLENGKVTGDSIEFQVKIAGFGRGGGGGGGGTPPPPTATTYKAKVTGDKMEGTSEREGSTRGPSPFTAEKAK